MKRQNKSANILKVYKFALLILLAFSICQSSCKPKRKIVSYKPVIYLYPENKTEVDVKLKLNGSFIATEPAYANGWKVNAEPDGSITNIKDEKKYPYLFWEAYLDMNFNVNEGFVVAGANSRNFLDTTLAVLGLTTNEKKEFIEYWAPKLEKNKWNKIRFAGNDYTNNAELQIVPKPDVMIRVYMVYKKANESENIPTQKLSAPPARKGFTVVEWGGSIADETSEENSL